MAAPKQIGLGGEAAWVGGNRAIDQCDNKSVLDCFILRRLQALAKVTHQADPTKLVSMSFEAMLLAIDNIAPNPALHYDHVALRGLYAKHCGTLTPEQTQMVAEWEATPAGMMVGVQLRETLKTSWRTVRATVFGDSATCNVFKKSVQSMLA